MTANHYTVGGPVATSEVKIFGIGLSKTGTTSLANALQILGYKTKDNMGVVKYAAGDLSSVDLDVVSAHDALTDTPIPSFYRELDALFPGSRFILTVRDQEGWLKSCKKQFTQRFAEVQTDAHKRLFTDLYGTDVFDDRRFASGYQRFIDGVRDHFKDRPHDLLTINVAVGEGWEKLCPFLGKPVPDTAFPKANVTQVRWMSIDDIVAVAKQAGDELLRYYPEKGETGFDRRNGSGQPGRTLKRLVDRALCSMRGESTEHAAARTAYKATVKGLTRLNPQIPVISRMVDAPTYELRRKWNHMWLVDPLDGERAFVRQSPEFSVNIALIEDGRPIYGVVHAPAKGITYYSTVGKGAYRRGRSGETVRLAPAGQADPAATLSAGRPAAKGPGTEGSSYALALCVLAEGATGDESFESSIEWQTAAAHAILGGAGMQLCHAESATELVYNKKDLSNPFITVGSADATALTTH